MNSRHQSWGDVTSNAKGEQLQQIIENIDLTVLNTNKPTHFHIQTGTFSCIDLSLASPNAFMDFEWDVLDDLFGSDHFPIIISNGNPVPVARAPRWCTDRADWPLFKELSNIEADVNDLPTVSEAISYLNSILINAANHSIPKTSGKFRRKPVPWWNIQCTIRHKAMRAAFTRYRRHRCTVYLICFKKARAQFRWHIKKARRECWILFLSSITWKTPMTLVWAKIKKIAGKFKPSPPPVLKINGLFVSDPKTVSEAFARHFAKVSSKNPDSPYYQLRSNEEARCLDFTANMVNARLVWFLERRGVISSAQCGFRRMHSCTDVLIRLEDSICNAFLSKQHHITVFFDLEKAYDTAWRYGILKVLHNIGLRASRMSVAERKLQLTIDKVARWASEHGFRFSPSKTVVMHFCRIRGHHPDPDLYLYARNTKLERLNAVHHAGVRIATGAFKSSPIPSLLVDAGELPLVLMRQSQMIKYWTRVQRLPNSLTVVEEKCQCVASELDTRTSLMAF
ncbi:uncharacterized protein LOC143034778 [Oratosquilla oratoria]|uniref:uncharacterized protein LOC143034778 n=1 Tax=Oratosquilla oratoria TaxID=337810 RepID=UPI003F76E0B3